MASNRHYKFRVDNYPLKVNREEEEDTEGVYFGEGLNYRIEDNGSIELHFANGDRQASVYSYMHYSTLKTEDDSQVIKVFMSTHLIVIKGIRLEKIHQHIKGGKLSYLKESNPTEIALANEEEPFITKINIEWHSKAGE